MQLQGFPIDSHTFVWVRRMIRTDLTSCLAGICILCFDCSVLMQDKAKVEKKPQQQAWASTAVWCTAMAILLISLLQCNIALGRFVHVYTEELHVYPLNTAILLVRIDQVQYKHVYTPHDSFANGSNHVPALYRFSYHYVFIHTHIHSLCWPRHRRKRPLLWLR